MSAAESPYRPSVNTCQDWSGFLATIRRDPGRRAPNMQVTPDTPSVPSRQRKEKGTAPEPSGELNKAKHPFSAIQNDSQPGQKTSQR